MPGTLTLRPRALTACRCCGFLQPQIMERLRHSDKAELRDIAFETMRAETAARTSRTILASYEGRTISPGPGRRRFIYDMEGRQNPVPQDPVRAENEPPVADEIVNFAFDHAGTTYDFYQEVFNRDSLDGAGQMLHLGVHHGQKVCNALWDGEYVLFGDGDGVYFHPFARSLAIVAHELTHGVISSSCRLAYENQPGALNESFCDVMSTLVTQRIAGVTASEADWLIGGDLAMPTLGIKGFRSFTADPAFADNPDIGSDTQPKHLKDYFDDPEDYGGVHSNSGIANHAFYLAAMKIGGLAWEKPGKIWYDGFMCLAPTAEFADAARETHRVAKREHGATSVEAEAVMEAWRDVGVEFED